MRIVGLLSILSTLLISNHVFGGKVTLPATVDGTVQFAGAFGLQVSSSDARVWTNQAGTNNIRSGVFEFDLTQLPVNADITNATLRLTTAEMITNTSREAPLTFQAYEGNGLIQIDDFGTTEGRNDTTMVVATTVLDAGTASPQSGSVVDVSFTNLEPLQRAVENSRFFGIRTMTEDFVSFQVHSLENGAGVRGPMLEVEFVPETSSCLMLIAGFLLVVGRCRNASRRSAP